VGLARRIWTRRNEVIHGGAFAHPVVLINNMKKANDFFNEVHKKQETTSTERVHSVCWTAPTTSWMKANWDASLDAGLLFVTLQGP
jgi:hypothetical protein